VLVTSGWYRITRNPMYLGMVVVLCGVALMAGSVGAWLPLPAFIAVIHYRFIRGEERFLEEIFGQPYRDYRARVRRWI
jgi:protein-S-isoprenylcysteine O-methyltransferase Ste14